ncbi:hypothetical protein FZEAL_9857 [Fusarium zealandicum]|uniref:NADP-dependent oxidoreductase domain-containing protein n=1 Tax=Fusarium zealandicum TaxID=1053134 RepID=A0A8H4U7P7_9HYPO|nr:hypothetical protein FZEAL_9857 [Fusarium zealandicum]
MAPNGKPALNLIFGGANATDPMARFDSPDEVNRVLDAFAARGYHQIDTARAYSPLAGGSSEPRIGAVKAGDRFAIDTKVMSGPGCHTKAEILKEIDISLEALKVKQINIEYLHVPDRTTKFEEACEAMDQAIKEGKIKHWGLCNYSAEEVQRMLEICEQHGFVKPIVYQGQYNPLVRGGEKELFPLLRQHGMAFYAFSPAAGGFFAIDRNNIKAGGRFDTSITPTQHSVGSLYSDFYMKPAIISATENAMQVMSKHGIGGHAAALRWTAHHSLISPEHGDAIIVGSSSLEQQEANMDVVEQGPLPDDVAASLSAVFEVTGDLIAYHL